jgi:hypothetical protein
MHFTRSAPQNILKLQIQRKAALAVNCGSCHDDWMSPALRQLECAVAMGGTLHFSLKSEANGEHSMAL